MFKLIQSRNLFKYANNLVAVRFQSTNKTETTINYIKNRIRNLRIYEDIELRPATLDWEYLLNKQNLSFIDLNNKNRKGLGNIQLVVSEFVKKLFYFLFL